MEELTEFQKRIYNTYLKYSRNGLPYKYRENFDKMSEFMVLNLNKLSLFFNKHPHLHINDFFEAPLYVYPDQPYPKIDYFLSRSAIRSYSLFKTQKENENPEKQFDSIKESFLFIMKFCLNNKILVENYLNHKNGIASSWLSHYRERKINPYSLMEIGDIIKSIDEHPKDIIDLFTENLTNKIVTFKVRYKQSPKAIDYVKRGTDKIKTFIKKELQSQK
jgi:hypothetical protein